MRRRTVRFIALPSSRCSNERLYQWSWAPEDEVQYYFGKPGYHEREDEPLVADGQEHTIVLYPETHK